MTVLCPFLKMLEEKSEAGGDSRAGRAVNSE